MIGERGGTTTPDAEDLLGLEQIGPRRDPLAGGRTARVVTCSCDFDAICLG